MEWLRKLLEGATIKDGKLDIDGLMKSINTEFPKNAVPKDKYNEVSNDLKTANKTLDDLKKNHKNIEELQTEIENYKNKAAESEAARAKEQKEFIIKSKLKDAGCTDVEYMLYKLGDVEKLDIEKELENKVKELTENNTSFFKNEGNEEPDKQEPKVLANKLPEDTPEEGNENIANVFADALSGKF